MFRYTLEKRQIAWTCQAEFMAATSSQFTDTQHASPIYASRWAWLAFLKCWMKAGHVKREIEKAHKPLRLANGWAAILLVLLSSCACDASDRKARGQAAWAWATAKAVPAEPAVKPSLTTGAKEAEPVSTVSTGSCSSGSCSSGSCSSGSCGTSERRGFFKRR